MDVRTGYGQFALSFQEVGILNDEFLCLYHTLSSVFFVKPRSFQVNPSSFHPVSKLRCPRKKPQLDLGRFGEGLVCGTGFRLTSTSRTLTPPMIAVSECCAQFEAVEGERCVWWVRKGGRCRESDTGVELFRRGFRLCGRTRRECAWLFRD